MDWKGLTKEYFSVNRKDRIAALFMAGITVIIYMLPRFLPAQSGDFIIADSSFVTFADPAKKRPNFSSSGNFETGDQKTSSETSLFSFDPNQLEDEGWLALGLTPKTVKTIRNYLSKGGKFRTRSDLAKIWGLPPGFYEKVKDHIELPVSGDFTSNNYSRPNYEPIERKPREIQMVRVNEDDSAALENLPGIGQKLASRIIGFREKLGGFYSVEQIGETYGLADSVFQKIKPYLSVDGNVRKININTATKEELKMHPYIRWNIANAIVEYRKQHGNFTSADDLKKIVLVDEKTFDKIRNYLEL